MEKRMNKVANESPYYIFMNGCDKMYVLGRNGQYETELSKAIKFTDKLDAIIYVEKHGYERISTIRRIAHKE